MTRDHGTEYVAPVRSEGCAAPSVDGPRTEQPDDFDGTLMDGLEDEPPYPLPDDRGPLTELHEGQAVTWFHTMRGGYGYVERVPAVVWRVGPKRVTILVSDKDGSTVTRSVAPENLIPKPVAHA